MYCNFNWINYSGRSDYLEELSQEYEEIFLVPAEELVYDQRQREDHALYEKPSPGVASESATIAPASPPHRAPQRREFVCVHI